MRAVSPLTTLLKRRSEPPRAGGRLLRNTLHGFVDSAPVVVSLQGVQRKGPAVAKIKAHSLTGRITYDLMRQAFRNVKRNRGAAGIDRVSIELYQHNLEENLLDRE